MTHFTWISSFKQIIFDSMKIVIMAYYSYNLKLKQEDFGTNESIHFWFEIH